MFTCQLWELQSFPLLWICLQQLLVVWSSGCANHWCWRWCLQPWVRSRQDCCPEHSSLQAATSHPRSRDFNRGKCLQTISLRKIILAYLNVPTDTLNWLIPGCCTGEWHPNLHSKMIFSVQETCLQLEKLWLRLPVLTTVACSWISWK